MIFKSACYCYCAINVALGEIKRSTLHAAWDTADKKIFRNIPRAFHCQLLLKQLKILSVHLADYMHALNHETGDAK